jgi:hypothetical protein
MCSSFWLMGSWLEALQEGGFALIDDGIKASRDPAMRYASSLCCPNGTRKLLFCPKWRQEGKRLIDLLSGLDTHGTSRVSGFPVDWMLMARGNMIIGTRRELRLPRNIKAHLGLQEQMFLHPRPTMGDMPTPLGTQPRQALLCQAIPVNPHTPLLLLLLLLALMLLQIPSLRSQCATQHSPAALHMWQLQPTWPLPRPTKAPPQQRL